MTGQQQGVYMSLLMAGREDEAIAYRDKCNMPKEDDNCPEDADK